MLIRLRFGLLIPQVPRTLLRLIISILVLTRTLLAQTASYAPRRNMQGIRSNLSRQIVLVIIDPWLRILSLSLWLGARRIVLNLRLPSASGHLPKFAMLTLRVNWLLSVNNVIKADCMRVLGAADVVADVGGTWLVPVMRRRLLRPVCLAPWGAGWAAPGLLGVPRLLLTSLGAMPYLWKSNWGISFTISQIFDSIISHRGTLIVLLIACHTQLGLRVALELSVTLLKVLFPLF